MKLRDFKPLTILKRVADKNLTKGGIMGIEELHKIVLEMKKEIEELRGEVAHLKSKKKKPAEVESGSSLVWESYQKAYLARYNTTPIRNAMTNRMINNLIARLGLEPSCRVVAYFVSQSDAYYVKKTHAFGLCLSDCESLHTRMQTGVIVTETHAKKTEKMSASLSASKTYLQKKYAAHKGNN